MNKELILQMQSQFDALAQTHPEATDVEFWFARDLQAPLGYARWENFLTAIQRAIESCKTTGYEVGHHFRGVTKLITHGKGGQDSSVTVRSVAQSLFMHVNPKRISL
jgi:DNA-damage-inducible protein D